MNARLPLVFKPIVDAEKDHRPSVEDGPMGHYIEFASGSTHLATFASTGPILTPVVGQEVSVHGVSVRVTEVNIAYEVTDEGKPAVYTTVVVVPADRTTDTKED